MIVPTPPLKHGYRITVEPARRMFGGRGQYKFSVRRIENNEPIDPRDTYANRAVLIGQMQSLVGSRDISIPVELVVLNRRGEVLERMRLR